MSDAIFGPLKGYSEMNHTGNYTTIDIPHNLIIIGNPGGRNYELEGIMI